MIWELGAGGLARRQRSGWLLAALYNLVWTAGIAGPGNFALACAAFLLLFMWQTPPHMADPALAGGDSVCRGRRAEAWLPLYA